MKSIGICTSARAINELNYEKRCLYIEAMKRFDLVILVDPRAVTHQFVRGEARPRIMLERRDISSLNTLLVRSTAGREAATGVLVRSLSLCGCDIFDPIERFSVGKASKLLTTISRFEKGLGTSTYISFGQQEAKTLVEQLGNEGKFPLVAKPGVGKLGRDIYVLETTETAMRYIEDYFDQQEYVQDPFLLQELVLFTREYRVLMVDGQALGAVEKIKLPDKLAANAAQGATFVAAELPQAIMTALASVSSEGVIGVDIGQDQHGDVHIIEENRAPLWEEFERAVGSNVAERILDRAEQRLQQKRLVAVQPDSALVFDG